MAPTHDDNATGLTGGQRFNRVLTEGGRADLVKAFATHTEYPSSGYMMKNGATTIWELWNGNTANSAMKSGNHVMQVGDFVFWLYESLVEIKADPEPIDELTSARASHRSPYSGIRCGWKREGERIEWNIIMPPNCTATAFVPCVDQASLHEPCRPISASAGLNLAAVNDGRVVLELAAGTYHFISK